MGKKKIFTSRHRQILKMLDKLILIVEQKGRLKIVVGNEELKINKQLFRDYLAMTYSSVKHFIDIFNSAKFELVDDINEVLDQMNNDSIEIPLEGGGVKKILPKERIEEIEREVEYIEKYYPGDNNLTELEKLCKAIFNSLHEYQYFIARHRNNEVQIFRDEDGISIISQE